MMRASLAASATILAMSLASCGGGGGSGNNFSVGTTTPPPVNNVQPVLADYGPIVGGQFVGFNNVLYTTVIICVPNTTTCQSIDHIVVDTGSSGLRIVSSQIALTLPYAMDASNNAIGNCIQYADTSFQWGPLAEVDVQLAGEVASSVPIQIVSWSAGPLPRR